MLRHPSSVNTICSSPCLAMPYLLTVSQDASARLYLTAAWNEPPQLLHAAPEQPSTLSAAASAFSPTGLYAAMAISEAPYLMLWRLGDGLLNRFSQPAQDATAALLTGVTGRDSATSAAPASARATTGASTLATAIASTAAAAAASAAASAAAPASASASSAYPATAVVARRAAAAAAAAAAARVASSTSGSSTGSTSAPFSLTKLAGHDGEVTNIYFSPCGNALLSGSRDGTARIWEWLGRPERGNVRVRVLAPSEDSHEEALASTSGNKPPVLWIDMVGWSNDGNFVFTAESLRKQVRLSHIWLLPHATRGTFRMPPPSLPTHHAPLFPHTTHATLVRPTLPTHATRHARAHHSSHTRHTPRCYADARGDVHLGMRAYLVSARPAAPADPHWYGPVVRDAFSPGGPSAALHRELRRLHLALGSLAAQEALAPRGAQAPTPLYPKSTLSLP